MTIEDIMAPWTSAHQDAAWREGWDLFTATEGSEVQVQRIDDPEVLEDESPGATYLPSDEVAMVKVRTGTGEHHSVARKILYDHFPEEWALLEKAAASVMP